MSKSSRLVRKIIGKAYAMATVKTIDMTPGTRGQEFGNVLKEEANKNMSNLPKNMKDKFLDRVMNKVNSKV